jgi:hypothetical protein
MEYEAMFYDILVCVCFAMLGTEPSAPVPHTYVKKKNHYSRIE